MTKPTEPTSEQCSQNARVADVNGRPAFACWYPQMGGYVGKAVVLPGWDDRNEEPDCFEAYVWHNGEFPFDEGDGRSPARLHHCMPQQFTEFGEWVAKVSEGLK